MKYGTLLHPRMLHTLCVTMRSLLHKLCKPILSYGNCPFRDGVRETWPEQVCMLGYRDWERADESLAQRAESIAPAWPPLGMALGT